MVGLLARITARVERTVIVYTGIVRLELFTFFPRNMVAAAADKTITVANVVSAIQGSTVTVLLLLKVLVVAADTTQRG